jgi:hypothetical protein
MAARFLLVLAACAGSVVLGQEPADVVLDQESTTSLASRDVVLDQEPATSLASRDVTERDCPAGTLCWPKCCQRTFVYNSEKRRCDEGFDGVGALLAPEVFDLSVNASGVAATTTLTSQPNVTSIDDQGYRLSLGCLNGYMYMKDVENKVQVTILLLFVSSEKFVF